MPHCLQKMKVEEAFPYESLSKVGNHVQGGVEWIPHCLQKMKVEEVFPYESISKIGNQEQGRGETTIKIYHIYFTKIICDENDEKKTTGKAETKRKSEPTRLHRVN